MKNIATVVILLCLVSTPGFAFDGTIEPSFRQDALSCDAIYSCQCADPLRLWIYGFLAGASAGGITGAEYKVQIGTNSNPDPGWVFAETFNPAATVIGSGAFNPVDSFQRGVNVAWPTCQQAGAGYPPLVLIETVDVLFVECSTSYPAQLRLQVVKHDHPSNQFLQCPLFVLCDAPVYTAICVGTNLTQCQNPEPPFPNNATCSTGGAAVINGTTTCCLSCDIGTNCPIAVEPRSWSRVKGLYRD